MTNDVEWGPWIADAIPQIGMYIQVKIQHKHTQATEFAEGTAGRYEGTFLVLFPDDGDRNRDWQAISWREGKFRGLDSEITKTRELETT